MAVTEMESFLVVINWFVIVCLFSVFFYLDEVLMDVRDGNVWIFHKLIILILFLYSSFFEWFGWWVAAVTEIVATFFHFSSIGFQIFCFGSTLLIWMEVCDSDKDGNMFFKDKPNWSLIIVLTICLSIS